jgi:hypothetical protein
MKTYGYLIIVSRSVLLRMTKFSNKFCRASQKTHFMFNNFSENHAVLGNMWKYMTEPDQPAELKICDLHAGLLSQGHTHTHSYLKDIAFPWQQWLREAASMLRYTYVAFLVSTGQNVSTTSRMCHRILQTRLPFVITMPRITIKTLLHTLPRTAIFHKNEAHAVCNYTVAATNQKQHIWNTQKKALQAIHVTGQCCPLAIKT